MIRNNYTMTIGFNDKITEKQEISTEEAKNIIADILINRFNVYAFTMWDCDGVYKMDSTGNIVKEKSVKVEIITDEEIPYIGVMIDRIKEALNQESVMLQQTKESVVFA